MARKKTVVVSDLTALVGGGFDKHNLVITAASIKDDFCHYSYEITGGVGLGDSHSVKGSGVIEDDMRTAFSKFNVHMAFIDDVFKHSGIEVEDIDAQHSNELTFLYTVTGFKIKGKEDNESIILIGNKYVSSAGGRIEMETPKIALDDLSSYKFYNELRDAAEKARNEVWLYKEGKCTIPESDEEEETRKQTKITFDSGTAGEAEDNYDDTFGQAAL